MKKNIMYFTAIVLCILLTGCAQRQQNIPNNPNNNVNNNTNNNQNVETGELTIEDVKNAPVTDETLFDVQVVENGVSITGFNGEDEIVVIPETINGKTVVSIGQTAFSNNDTMRGIKIADTVRIIGRGAFVNCVALEVVVMGKNVKSLQPSSFGLCKNLKTVELNDGLEEISAAFVCKNLKELEIPSSVTKMVVPVTNHNAEKFVIIGEAGSYAEQYVKEKGESENLVFQAK